MKKIGLTWHDVRGVGAVEYALVASLISIAAITAVGSLGDKIQSHYRQTDNSLAKSL
jgi:Flp pilus assembly pilin Flp